MDLFSNLRPAQCFDALADFSSLKKEVVAGLDIVIVRELTSGVYFGEPRGIFKEGNERVGINTQRYTESEIARVARSAFELAGLSRSCLRRLLSNRPVRPSMPPETSSFPGLWTPMDTQDTASPAGWVKV